MDKGFKKNRKLNNSFTHFGAFTWGEDPKLRAALEEAGQRLGFYKPVIRLRVKL